MTRKLFRVSVGRGEYTPSETVFTVEADSHEEAARAAVNNYAEETRVTVLARHIPFTSIKSVGDSTTVATKFRGDGEQTFVLDVPNLTNKVMYPLSGNALVWVWGATVGFILGWILGGPLP